VFINALIIHPRVLKNCPILPLHLSVYRARHSKYCDGNCAAWHLSPSVCKV